MPDFTLVFDLDGTLADTAADLAAALNAALAAEGLPAQDLAAVRGMIGDGTLALLQRGIAASGGEVPPTRMHELHERLLDYYAEHVVDSSVLYADVAATLARLAGAGFRLSVCTNKPEALARAIVDRLEVATLFASLCGGDTCRARKPDPEPLREAILRAGGTPERALMVGDSANDVRTARAAGVPVVLVDYGYTDIPARELGADRVVGAFAAIEPVAAEFARR
jgi:phosphoglycolate phosphatase